MDDDLLRTSEDWLRTDDASEGKKPFCGKGFCLDVVVEHELLGRSSDLE
jgi:hypothetical protein